MSTMPPNVPPPNMPPGPPPGYDPRAQRRWYRDQARAQRAAWKAHRMQMQWQVRGMRRASILGPLLLIAAGVVFLLIQTGRINRHDFFASYAHWWPLVLVGAGLIVLAEWSLDQFHMRNPDLPPYRRSIGGAVFLLIMVILIGVIAEAGVNFSHEKGDWIAHLFYNGNMDDDSWAEFFGDKHEFDQVLDAPYATGSSAIIVNPRGDITVSGTSDDGRIHITEHKTVYAGSDSDAEDRARQIAAQTTSDGSETRVSVPSLDGAHADLTITVPPDAVATINANRGNIHVASMKAALTVTANHGNIELQGITGPVTAHINSGGSSLTAHSLDQGITVQGHANQLTLTNVTGPVTINGEIFSETHMESIHGTVHYHTSRTDIQLVRLDGTLQIGEPDISIDQAQGPLVLTTSNHNVSLDRVAGDIAVTDRNGTVEVTAAPALGNVTIESRNGTVKATLPEHANFAVQADTTNGNIDTNLHFTTGSDQLEEIGNRNEKIMNGVVGSAADAPTVHIRTSNGDISILKADVQPLTPPAPPAKITMTPPTGPNSKLVHPPKPPKAPPAPAPPAAPTP